MIETRRPPLQVTETQAAQIQLDRAAEDYRRLHAERQQLIAQWDEAAAAMRRRDVAIQAASAAFAERRLALRRRRGELDAQARFLEAEVAANRELEARIAHYEKEVVSARAGARLQTCSSPGTESPLTCRRAAFRGAWPPARIAVPSVQLARWHPSTVCPFMPYVCLSHTGRPARCAPRGVGQAGGPEPRGGS